MKKPRVILALAALAFAACRSTTPTVADMERYYHEAELQVQRDIARLAERRSRGEISSEEYERREAAIRESIPRRANRMAWARHELAQSEMRSMSIPTPGSPVQIDAPGRGTSGDSFYRAAGQISPGYQGTGGGTGRGSF